MSLIVLAFIIVGIIILTMGIKKKNKKAYIASATFFGLGMLGIVAMFIAGTSM